MLFWSDTRFSYQYNMQQPDLKIILGVIGNATAMALFLSPMPTFVRVYKTRSTQEFSGLPYICALCNCILWVLYGMPFVRPHSILLVTINGFGAALEILYLIIYLRYAARDRKVQMARLIAAAITMYGIIILITLFGLHSLSKRELVVGSLCVIFAVAMYTSPLSVMGMVIRTRSVEYMPFLLSLFNFTNSAVWSAYSLVTKDIFVAIPNGLGCLSGIAQLVIYGMYKNAVPTTSMIKDKCKKTNEYEQDVEKNVNEKPTSKPNSDRRENLAAN